MDTIIKFLAAGTLLLGGCSQKQVKTPEDLQAAFATAAATSSNSTPSDVSVFLNSAVTALKNNDQVGAVAALQTLRGTPGLSIDQQGAVQDMLAKANSQLAERAARGDQQAIAALRLQQMNPH